MNTCVHGSQVQAGWDLRGGQTPTQKFAQHSNSPFICTAPHSTGPSTQVLHSSGFGFTLARPYGSRSRARWRLFPPPTVHHEHHCDRSLLPRVLKRPYPAGGKPAAGTTVSTGATVSTSSQRRSKSRRNGPKKGTEETNRRNGPKKRAEERDVDVTGRRKVKDSKRRAEETSSRTSTT